MRNRSLIVPALTGFAVSALFIFMSCASQERSEDDPLGELGQESSAEGGSGKSAKNGSEDTALADLGPTEDLGKTDGLGLPSEDEMANTAEADPALADLPPDEPRKKGASSGSENLSSEDLSKDPALNDVLGLPSDTEIAKLEKEEQQVETRSARSGGANPSLEQMWSGNSRVPSIPPTAKTRNGALLNRFYFLRQGDTPATVSELLYGSAQREKDLKKWNKGAFKPGKLIYYQSPNASADTQMQSFYKERGIQNGEYTVKKKDWLSRIAKQMLGSAGSWKEIAVINGLPSADAIEPGQRLAIYPADLRNGAPTGTQTTAGGPDQPSTPSPANDPATPGSFQAETNVQFAPPVPDGGPTRKPKKSGFDIARFLQQELLTIVLGVVGILCLVVLLMAKKRRKARQAASSDEVNEDIFGAGGK